jgi:signal peptidase I
MSKHDPAKVLLEKTSGKPWYREWSEAIGVALVLALIIRTFLFQAFKIPSGSMEDTLLIGDHLLVNKFIYGSHLPWSDDRFLVLRNPQRGDVIVFEFPMDAELPFYKRRDFIKRVIGVPGDVVEVRNKVVYINDEAVVLPQEVHKGPTFTDDARRDDLSPIKVPQGQYFVMGDNRDRSFDSRFWGFVDKSEIKGLAFVKYWSWDSTNNRPRWSRIGRTIK